MANDIYAKAGILMQSALKKYEEGNIEGAERDRQMANDMYDKAGVDDTAMLYGENRNFGTIYKVFESNTAKLFKDKNGSAKIRKILKLIKENKTLKAEFDIYKALVYPESVTNAENYVNEAVSLIPLLNKKDIVENNQKFIDTIRNLKLDEMIDISDDDLRLYESVEYLMLNKKGFNNINEYANAKKCISEHIEKNCNSVVVNENETVDNILEKGVKELDENYQNNLNDDEKMLVEKLNRIKSKEAYFDIAKNDVIKALNEQLSECDEENQEGLQKIIENVSNMMFNESKFIADAAEFMEIKNTLNESPDFSDDKLRELINRLVNALTGVQYCNKDWLMAELQYHMLNDVDAEKIIADVEDMVNKYSPEDIADIVVARKKAGKYKNSYTGY